MIPGSIRIQATIIKQTWFIYNPSKNKSFYMYYYSLV